MTLAFIEGLFSPTHLLLFAFVALLIFGRRLPEIGRNMGKGITEFKKGLKEAGDEVSGQPQDPYQQGYNQQQLNPPQRPAQQYQQPGYQGQQPGYQAQQPGYQNPPPPYAPAQQQPYAGGYQQPPQAQRLPQQPAAPAQPQVRVTRNDMVD